MWTPAQRDTLCYSQLSVESKKEKKEKYVQELRKIQPTSTQWMDFILSRRL